MQDEHLGLDKRAGDSHYRAYVGPPGDYDLVAAMSFGLLTVLGLRQHHRVLDIGCGSLRVGRLLIPYLNRGGYTGIEPHAWLVEEGARSETGHEQLELKQARFVYADNADELVDAGASFHFALAQSIFSHCGPDLLDQWLAQVSRLLEPDGALIATYLPSEDDTQERGWIYPDCVSYRPATIAEHAGRHGLQALDLDWRHPRQRWVLMARPGFDMEAISGGRLSWNALFDRFRARRQTP
jgi:cyclopropane fatty-acyl-phospholipid synthase-like methyltransferase